MLNTAKEPIIREGSPFPMLCGNIPIVRRCAQTDIANNNNKFYVMQLVNNPSGHHYVFARWGRVGECLLAPPTPSCK